jgi:hypothetical protein
LSKPPCWHARQVSRRHSLCKICHTRYAHRSTLFTVSHRCCAKIVR